MEIKQNDEASSSILMEVCEERWRMEAILRDPQALERELVNISNEKKIEYYQLALKMNEEPQDIKDLLCFSILRLEEEEIIQMYMEAKQRNDESRLKRNQDLIDEICSTISKHQKEKKSMVYQIKKFFRP